jgi:hypothetical protein
MPNDSVAEMATVDNANPILHSKQTGWIEAEGKIT